MLASISMPNDFFNGFFVIRVATLLASLGPFYVLLSSIGFPLNPAPYALFRSIPFSLSLCRLLYFGQCCCLARSQLLFICLFCQHLVVISAFLKLSTVTHGFPLKVSVGFLFNRKSLSPSCSLPPALSIEKAVRATWQLVWLFSHIFHAKPCQVESNPELESESESELELET